MLEAKAYVPDASQRELRIVAAAPVELAAAAESGDAADGAKKVRSFKMTAYTGGAMALGYFASPVVVDLSGLTIRGKQKPILRDHSPGQVVGHTTEIDVAGGKQIKLSGLVSGAGPSVQEILQAADNGFPWQASIGCSVQRLAFVDEGEKVTVNGQKFTGPLYVARAATLREVSFVALGADDNTSARIAAGAHQEGDTMTFEAWLEAKGFLNAGADLSPAQMTSLRAMFDAEQEPADPPAPVVKASDPLTGDDDDDDDDNSVAQLRAAHAVEIKRINAIHTLCVAAGATGLEIEASAVEGGWTAEKTELEILRKSRPKAPAGHVRGHDQDCTLEAMQGAMILRANGRLDHPLYAGPIGLAMDLPKWLRAGLNTEARQRAMEFAHRYSDLSALDLCREALRIEGREIRGGRKAIIQAAFSGSTLTNIFTTSVNAILLATYGEAGDTTDGWCSVTDVADFKTNERPRMSKGPNLEKLPRGGEADHLTRSDQVESYKIARYAKQFVVDEQDVIDDSLNALADTPREMGNAAARLRPDLVYALLIRNAALGADSVALFHADHSNLQTSSALTNATVKACIAAIEKQRENSVNLGLKASHLIVPSDLKHEAAQIISSSLVGWGADNETERGTLNTINSMENLTLVSEPRLSNGVTDPVDGVAQSGSATTWFMASNMGHNIEIAYLRGTGRAPQVRSFVLSQGKYGVGWDVAIDIGAKALDFHGLSKNTA